MKNKKAYWRLSQLRHMDLRTCPCFWTFPLSLTRILCLNQVLADEPSWNTGEGVLMRDVLWLYLHCWKPSETSEMGSSKAMEMLLTCRQSPICRGRWGWTVNPPGWAQGVISLSHLRLNLWEAQWWSRKSCLSPISSFSISYVCNPDS